MLSVIYLFEYILSSNLFQDIRISRCGTIFSETTITQRPNDFGVINCSSSYNFQQLSKPRIFENEKQLKQKNQRSDLCKTATETTCQTATKTSIEQHAVDLALARIQFCIVKSINFHGQ